MKARIIAVQVIPQIVIVDDDYQPIPQQVQPMMVLWRDWPEFAAHGIQDALAQLQAKLDAQTPQQKKDEALDRIDTLRRIAHYNATAPGDESGAG